MRTCRGTNHWSEPLWHCIPRMHLPLLSLGKRLSAGLLLVLFTCMRRSSDASCMAPRSELSYDSPRFPVHSHTVPFLLASCLLCTYPKPPTLRPPYTSSPLPFVMLFRTVHPNSLPTTVLDSRLLASRALELCDGSTLCGLRRPDTPQTEPHQIPAWEISLASCPRY